MSAFITIQVSIKNPEKFGEYSQKSSATLSPFGGEIVIKGKFDGSLAGKATAHQMAGVVKFPNQESLDNWYMSDAYQALIPLRDEAADIILTKYESA